MFGATRDRADRAVALGWDSTTAGEARRDQLSGGRADGVAFVIRHGAVGGRAQQVTREEGKRLMMLGADDV